MFLHGSPMHLVFDMYMLYQLGGLVEIRRGSLVLAGLVLATQMGADVGKSGTVSPTSSASPGAVYGLFGYIWMKSRFDPAAGLFIDPARHDHAGLAADRADAGHEHRQRGPYRRAGRGGSLGLPGLAAVAPIVRQFDRAMKRLLDGTPFPLRQGWRDAAGITFSGGLPGGLPASRFGATAKRDKIGRRG